MVDVPDEVPIGVGVFEGDPTGLSVRVPVPEADEPGELVVVLVPVPLPVLLPKAVRVAVRVEVATALRDPVGTTELERVRVLPEVRVVVPVGLSATARDRVAVVVGVGIAARDRVAVVVGVGRTPPRARDRVAEAVPVGRTPPTRDRVAEGVAVGRTPPPTRDRVAEALAVGRTPPPTRDRVAEAVTVAVPIGGCPPIGLMITNRVNNEVNRRIYVYNTKSA